jgi:hypothetical protein
MKHKAHAYSGGPFVGDYMRADGFRVHIFRSRTANRCDAKAFSHSPKSKPKNPKCSLCPQHNMTGWSVGSPNDVSRDDLEPQPNRRAIDFRQGLAVLSSVLAVWIIPVMMRNHYRPLPMESILPGYPASGERDRTFQHHFVHVTTTVPFKAARL